MKMERIEHIHEEKLKREIQTVWLDDGALYL